MYRTAIEFLVLADDVAASLPKGRAYMVDQLRRASTSISLNIAEGAGEFSKDDKARLCRMARRFARGPPRSSDHTPSEERSCLVGRVHARIAKITMFGGGEIRSQVPVQPGELLAGKYEVERILGAGGMGIVVQAMHVDLQQDLPSGRLQVKASGL